MFKVCAVRVVLIHLFLCAHLLPLLDEILSADVSHDAGSQSVAHDVDHGPESIPGQHS